MATVTNQTADSVLQITLDDPVKRNALGIEMFDSIDATIKRINDDTRCVLLLGRGEVFCSGFDMKACVDDITVLEQYILRLSSLIRSLRRVQVPVVVAAHGAAIAGGCAVLTGCDFVVGSKESTYGYPVHRLGISPAVTIPTLFQKLGEGRARALVMSGELIDGEEAYAIGLLAMKLGKCYINSGKSKLLTRSPVSDYVQNVRNINNKISIDITSTSRTTLATIWCPIPNHCKNICDTYDTITIDITIARGWLHCWLKVHHNRKVIARD
jgi:methylglutaconyl-CoA hydratase